MHPNLVVIFVLIFTGIARAAVIEIWEESSTTITCDLNVQYPAWTGPDGLEVPLTSGQTINEDGIEWVNNKDLKIAKVMLKHDGNYTCSDNNGNSKTSEVNVQYFSASARLSLASTENTTSVLTCYCRSNPPCKIHPVIHSYGMHVNSKTTFHPCIADPSAENRTKCSLTATLGMKKEVNGVRESSCEFEYRKIVNYLKIYTQNKFYFPPTYVNMTARKVDKTITVKCSTDSSNPVAVLRWYKGVNPVAKENWYITGSYDEVVVDAEYNGKNISQLIDIKDDNINDKERIFCCAKQLNTEICESIQLGLFRETSDGIIHTVRITMFVACVAIGLL